MIRRWWRRWRGQPRPSAEAVQALADAETKLAAARAGRPAVESLVGRLAELRRTNHLADRVWAALRSPR